MKNYLKANTFRARPIDTIACFDDEDPADTIAAWERVNEMCRELRAVPVVYRRRNLATWPGVEAVIR